MANPATIDARPAIIEATTTEQSLTIARQRAYTLSHNGQDSAGLASTDPIYVSVDAAVDADAGEGADKVILFDNRSVEIGPGVAAIKFKTAAGSPTFQIVPGIAT